MVMLSGVHVGISRLGGTFVLIFAKSKPAISLHGDVPNRTCVPPPPHCPEKKKNRSPLRNLYLGF